MANDKPTTGGAVYIPEASSPEAIKNMANFFGTYFLKGLGVLGQIMTAPLTQSDPISSAHKSRELINQERAVLNEAERQAGVVMSYLSPLNYGVALATGNGLDPIAGEEEIATWEPYQQALARGAELYTIPKVTKGISKGASKAYDRFGRKLPVILIEPEANPEHFRFAEGYEDYWTPIEYTEETTLPKYPYPKYKPIREPKPPKTFNHPWVYPHLGRQLRSLMKGTPLEAQVDKYGLISVKALRLYFGEPKKPGSGRSKLERYIVNKVLESPLNRGKSKINFNSFKDDVFYALHNITLSTSYRSPFGSGPALNLGYNPYGYVDTKSHLGLLLEKYYPDRFKQDLESFDVVDLTTGKVVENFEDYKDLIPEYTSSYNINLNTEAIPITTTSKYHLYNSIGENNLFNVSTEPDILYVGDIDSKWATLPKPNPNDVKARTNYAIKNMRALSLIRALQNDKAQGVTGNRANILQQLNDLLINFPILYQDPLVPYIRNTFFRRLVLSILNTADRAGYRIVRFPTPETLEKMGSYRIHLNPRKEAIRKLLLKALLEVETLFDTKGTTSPEYIEAVKKALYLTALLEEGPAFVPTLGNITKVSRFNSIPKILRQVIPESEVHLVTDSKGNTWYEVEVPHNYLYTEQMYKKGGRINGKL